MKSLFRKSMKNEQEEIPTEPIRGISNDNIGIKFDKKYFEWGVKEASYLTGFATAFTPLELSEKNITAIIINKINLEYQKEMLRMKLETDEHVMSKYKSIENFIKEDDD